MAFEKNKIGYFKVAMTGMLFVLFQNQLSNPVDKWVVKKNLKNARNSLGLRGLNIKHKSVTMFQREKTRYALK